MCVCVFTDNLIITTLKQIKAELRAHTGSTLICADNSRYFHYYELLTSSHTRHNVHVFRPHQQTTNRKHKIRQFGTCSSFTLKVSKRLQIAEAPSDLDLGDVQYKHS